MTGSNDRRRWDEPDVGEPDGGYHHELDDDESVTEAVISTVSSAKGVDPTDLEPLYDVIDPDALDALFGPRVGDTPSNARIEFEYAGCDVVVYASGRVVVDREGRGGDGTV